MSSILSYLPVTPLQCTGKKVPYEFHKADVFFAPGPYVANSDEGAEEVSGAADTPESELVLQPWEYLVVALRWKLGEIVC